MHTARRFLVTVLVPALIVSIFAVGSAAANGSSGKVNLCHWASHKFVEISVSMNAKPAHMQHGDVEPDEYGDCSGGGEGGQEGDSEDNDDEHDGDSRTCEGARSKASHVFQSWDSSGRGSGESRRSGGHGDRD